MARLMLIAGFAYNNVKNVNIDHTLFALNYGYHPHIFFGNKADPYSKFYITNEKAKRLKDLIFIY